MQPVQSLTMILSHAATFCRAGLRAVVAGGIGTMLVVGAWMKLFPPLRQVNSFNDVAV